MFRECLQSQTFLSADTHWVITDFFRLWANFFCSVVFCEKYNVKWNELSVSLKERENRFLLFQSLFGTEVQVFDSECYRCQCYAMLCSAQTLIRCHSSAELISHLAHSLWQTIADILLSLMAGICSPLLKRNSIILLFRFAI